MSSEQSNELARSERVFPELIKTERIANMLPFAMNKFHLKPCRSDRHVTFSADRIEGPVGIESMWKEPMGLSRHFASLSDQGICEIGASLSF